MNQEQESYLLHLIAMALAGHSRDVIEKTREIEGLIMKEFNDLGGWNDRE